MPTTRFLDLDVVRKPIGEFKVGSKRYKVWPMKVKQLINLEADASAADTQQGGTAQLLDMLEGTIPDCPRDVLENLDTEQLRTLMAWVNSAGQEDAAKNSTPLPPTVPETTAAA